MCCWVSHCRLLTCYRMESSLIYGADLCCRLLQEMQLPDMPIAFNSDDWPSKDEDVGGGPYFGYCNLPKITSNLPFPDLTGTASLSCGKDCAPFTETDHRKDQAVFLGRPTGMVLQLLKFPATGWFLVSAKLGVFTCRIAVMPSTNKHCTRNMACH